MRADETDAAAVELEMLAPFERLDLRSRQRDDPRDERERKRIRLAANLREHCPENRQRDRQLQLERGATTGNRRYADRAAYLFHHVLHGIEPDAAPRDVGNAV